MTGALFLLLALALAGGPDPKRAEARARFDRGIALLEEHGDDEALAEFQRAYDLVPDRQTLLMIGVVYANLKRPVEAVRTFDRVLADPGTLTPRQLAVARERRESEGRKVAYLRVTTSVPALVQVDGVDAGHTPAAEPLPVAAGTRLVAALSPGFLPTRKEVTIAGGVTLDLALDLPPSELRAAHLTVRSALPDADVFVDGERVARTPLPGSLTVAPGQRLVELRRPGYATAAGKVTLGDGATAELALEPTEQPDATRGLLAVSASEPEVELTVDGGGRGVYRQPIGLPAGRHLVRVARAGFLAVERMVEIPAAGSAELRATLVPTPEQRASYLARARAMRRWGWIAAGTGGAVVAAAGIFLAASAPALGHARRDRDALQATFNSGGACDSFNPQRDPRDCERDLAAANDLVAARSGRVTGGLVLLGAGVAALGTGAALLLGGDDPRRYDRSGEVGLVLDGRGAALLLRGRW